MIELPANITDETGHTYGRLYVVAFAGISGGKAAWQCRCECGAEVVSRGDHLRTGRKVSCGCYRADSSVRQAARLNVSPRRRKQIAKMGAAARHHKD